jgi:hypothetical protein
MMSFTVNDKSSSGLNWRMQIETILSAGTFNDRASCSRAECTRAQGFASTSATLIGSPEKRVEGLMPRQSSIPITEKLSARRLQIEKRL